VGARPGPVDEVALGKERTTDSEEGRGALRGRVGGRYVIKPLGVLGNMCSPSLEDRSTRSSDRGVPGSPASNRSGRAPFGPRSGAFPAAALLSLALALLLLAPGLNLSFPATNAASAPVVGTKLAAVVPPFPVGAPWKTVPYALPNVGAREVGSYAGTLHVLLTFQLSHRSGLADYLTALSDPKSPLYHEYITRATFAEEYGAPPTFYAQAEQFFDSYPGLTVTPFADHVSLELSGPASVVGAVMHVPIDRFLADGRSFYSATRSPSLPSWVASQVAQVGGLDDFTVGSVNAAAQRVEPNSPHAPTEVGGYRAPANYSGAQFEFAPDLQVAYDEASLLNLTYPTREVVATILQAGQAANGTFLGPYVPQDLVDYFNETLPAWQPKPQVYPVPLEGMPLPGPAASFDITRAQLENTIDLEMVGSLAPGAQVYNVYTQSITPNEMDLAFGYILNPNDSFSALNNVSVISNSWSFYDGNDTGWYTDLQEAQARGITVLAASGDSASNANSSFYEGGPDLLSFPSAMAYNDFGVTAVGGTSVNLSSSLFLASQVAWNDTRNLTGSAGGVSAVFPEPDWQANSLANRLIEGAGRGAPDVAAMANNTVVTLSVNGHEYRASNASNGSPFYEVWGTSVASPIVAGVIATIDAVLNRSGEPNLGFLDPTLYALGDAQYGPVTGNATVGYEFSSTTYQSTLPALPFWDVTQGRNDLYSALPGYDLVTGWGSIDAYNLTLFVDLANSTGVAGALGGVRNTFELTAMNVSSYFYGYPFPDYYNASVQQNFIVADRFGAPLYWVQNVIYIAGSPSTGWQMNFTGWVIYPFYGIYYQDVAYEYDFPLNGTTITPPQLFDIRTWITSPTSFLGAKAVFEIDGQLLTLPLPGGAYILGDYSSTYNYQGLNYSNGPFPDNPTPGGLAPQFALVGGPGGSSGEFTAPTSGLLRAWVAPLGLTYWVPARGMPFDENNSQTGESAQNLSWQLVGDAWQLSVVPGAASQGVLFYDTPWTTVTFEETGLPPGTPWGILSNGTWTNTTLSSLALELSPGAYNTTVGFVAGYHLSARWGLIDVNGSASTFVVSFARTTYLVTFLTAGLPAGTGWSMVVDGSPYSTVGPWILVNLPNGTFDYVVRSAAGYTPNQTSGAVVVNDGPVTVPVGYHPFQFAVLFEESGLPSGTSWSVTLGSSTYSSTTPTITFHEPNGSYEYSVAAVPGYVELLAPGVVEVANDTPLTVANFTEVLAVGAFSVTPSTVTEGSSATFRLALVGGVAPFTVGYGGLPKNCSSENVSTLTCVPEASGPFNVTVYVIDHLGEQAHASASLVVKAPPPPPKGNGTATLLGLPEWEFALILVVGVAVIAAVALLLLRRPTAKGAGKGKPAAPPPVDPVRVPER
jgi:hypothetical protein